ncbi:MAG TPA: BrnT family toxin [Rhizomicrobium sp.]
MKISFDPAKREKTLKERNLDFLRATEIFDGLTFTQRDDRRDYGEFRYQTYGVLDGKMVMVVWTYRFEARHIISLRKCNARERKAFAARLGGP